MIVRLLRSSNGQIDEAEKMIPPSAHYEPNFIDHHNATRLLSEIDAAPWRDDLKRRVQHYGYRYDYKARRVTSDSYLGPLPSWLDAIGGRLLADGYFAQRPDQVIVNEYLPARGIAPHIDCEPCFGDVVASLSLGSGCIMAFAHSETGETMSHYLEPGSLVVLRGESRFDWTHGIPARKSDFVDGLAITRQRRVSLTFRTVIAAA